MNKVYDNGYRLIGTKKDLEKYCNKLIKESDDEEIIDLAKETIEEIKDFEDNTIIAINYENTMGLYVDEVWKERDEVK